MDKNLRLGWGTWVGIGAAVLAVAAAGGLAACQNTGGGAGGSGTGGGTGMGGSTGSGVPGAFTPQGCQFSVAPRMEYQMWATSTPTVGATPHIRRVRLGLGGNVQGNTGRADPSTEFGTAWQTDDGTLASEVEWGTGPDPTKWPATNRTSGVTWLTPPGDINPNGPERMHEAYVCGLTPATTYYYRVGGGPMGSEVWSDVFSFTTTPKAGPATVTFAITGDSRGEQNNAWQILQRKLHTLAPTMALFSGDVLNLGTDQTEWEEWLDKASLDADGKTYLTLAQLLTVVAHGNHDNHTSLFYGNVVMPQDIGKYPQYAELFYSFDVGPVHVVVMDDDYVANPSGDGMYDGIFQPWLEADLMAANANRANVPWVITMRHRPDYSSSDHSTDPDVLRARQLFAPLMQKYHVDMAFGGHDHDYERSKVLTVGADVTNPTPGTDATMGTTYVVCAGSGADGYSAKTMGWTAVSRDYVAGGTTVIGLYAILTADAHNLKLEAHELHTDGSDPIFDTYTIMK